jgi:hypothetical protein
VLGRFTTEVTEEDELLSWFPGDVLCADCIRRGFGHEPLAPARHRRDEFVCASCGGSGIVVIRDEYDAEADLVECPRCGGEGVRVGRPADPSGFWSSG